MPHQPFALTWFEPGVGQHMDHFGSYAQAVEWANCYAVPGTWIISADFRSIPRKQEAPIG